MPSALKGAPAPPTERFCMQLSRRTIAAFLGIFIGAATAGAQADTVQPSAAATSAYLQGQSYERLFQDVYLAPGTCGIVLERAQCARDLETIAAMRNADATDTRVRAWFSTGDISMQVKDWSDVRVPDEAWSSTPVFAWWYTAGAASIAASLPQGSGIDAYVGSIADVLAQHTSAAPDTSGDWSPTGATPYARLASVQTQLQQIFPVAPYPAPVFAAGTASYAQLGVFVATAQELVDNSFALSRPESRAFVAAVLAKLQSVHEAFADGLTAAPMQAAINAPLLADNAWLDKTWRKPLSASLNTKWPTEPRDAFILGVLVAQVAYNAAVLKDPASDTQFRGVIATLPPWPGMSAKTRASIAALQNIPYADKGGKWSAINAAATTAVHNIINEPAPSP